MKTKTPKDSPISVLYSAAKQIVDETRKVFSSQGQDAREIRLPILMHGTDMRVTIESGPAVAARNAVEHAQMQASGKPVEKTVDMSQALKDAQTTLLFYAGRHHEPGSDEYGRILKLAQTLKEVERLV